MPSVSRVAFGHVTVLPRHWLRIPSLYVENFDIAIKNGDEDGDFWRYRSLMDPKSMDTQAQTGRIHLQIQRWADWTNILKINGNSTQDSISIQRLAQLSIASNDHRLQMSFIEYMRRFLDYYDNDINHAIARAHKKEAAEIRKWLLSNFAEDIHKTERNQL